MATNFPASLDSLVNPSAGSSLDSPSHSGQHTDANDAIEALQVKVGIDSSADASSLDYKVSQAATLTGSQTLTNKTLTSPVLNSANLAAVEEKWNIVASAPSTVTLYPSQGSVWYYTSDTTADFAVLLEHTSGSSLDANLNVGDSITVALVVKNGATAYKPSTILVDWNSGGASGILWQGGGGIPNGNANSYDVYVFTILKVASLAYTVFASQTRFAV